MSTTTFTNTLMARIVRQGSIVTLMAAAGVSMNSIGRITRPVLVVMANTMAIIMSTIMIMTMTMTTNK